MLSPWVHPPCPHLPPPDEAADHRVFATHGGRRDPAFYLTALGYANTLWTRGFAGRAVLCLDRALGADVAAGDPALLESPLPYRALAWIAGRAPARELVGNLRVHYQHLADRLRGARREQRAARAWACWVVTRAVLPHLPRDPEHAVREPAEDEIGEWLLRHGHPGEAAAWRAVVNDVLAAAQSGKPID